MKGMYPRRTPNSNARRRSATARRSTPRLLGKSYGEAGMRDQALAIVREFDEMQRRRYVAPHCYVYVYYGLGERERALLTRRTRTGTADSR